MKSRTGSVAANKIATPPGIFCASATRRVLYSALGTDSKACATEKNELTSSTNRTESLFITNLDTSVRNLQEKNSLKCPSDKASHASPAPRFLHARTAPAADSISPYTNIRTQTKSGTGS